MDWSDSCNYDREVSWQGRLDKTLERQKRKLNDNRIKHTGIPEDVLVIKRKNTINGDKISKVIVDQKLINIIFPVLKDIPVRQVSREFGNGYTLTALVNSHGEGSGKGQGTEQKDLTTIDVYAPIDSNLEVEDTIVRVFVNEQVKTSTVIVFTVRDVLADMSNNAPLNLKAKLSIDTEPIDLNKPSYQMIVALAKRRLAANY